MMKNPVLIRTFTAQAEIAADIAFLKLHKIEFSIQGVEVNLIPFLQQSSNLDKGLFIDEEDLSLYEELLENSLENFPEQNNALEMMTSDELMEIITKPDEWSYDALIIAKKLLSDKGIQVSDKELKEIKEARINELSKYEHGSTLSIMLGFILPVLGILTLSYISLFGFLLIAFGFGVGINFLLNFKRLPDNSKIKFYDQDTRTLGIIIICWNLFVMFASFYYLLNYLA